MKATGIVRPVDGNTKEGVNHHVSKDFARLYGPVPTLRMETQLGGTARI